MMVRKAHGGAGRWSDRSCASLNRSSPGYFETAAPPRFAAFGADLESPGMLAAAARQIAWRGEVILTCGDGTDYASPTALNAVLQFYALKLHHVLYVSDSAASCAALRRAVPALACVWSSLINATKPAHDSVCVKKYWDKRFYFYNLRKHYLMRLTSELGLRSCCRAPSWQRHCSPPGLLGQTRLALGGAPHSGGSTRPLGTQLRGRGTGSSPDQKLRPKAPTKSCRSCGFPQQASTCCRQTPTWSGSQTPTPRSTRARWRSRL